MTSIPKIRPSQIPGTWYEDNPQVLRKQVEQYIQTAALPELPGEVMGVIAPHAGYRYSGATAGAAFRAVQGRHFDLVAIVSPYHNFATSTFLTSAHAAYATPLGEVEIDRDATRTVDAFLHQQGFPGLSPIPYDREHSLEIELPFLQVALPAPFKLLPVMVLTRDLTDTRALGLALAETLRGKNALLVASTDLSHKYPEPVANQLDAEMLAQFAAFSPEGALRAEMEGQGYACGLGAVCAVMYAARELGADQIKLLSHTTSAASSGLYHSVVGYGAAAILKSI